MALQDSELSRIILVSLAETTPVREAAALQEDLKRAGIGTYSWVISQSFSNRKNLKDPLLKSRALAEVDVIHKIGQSLTKRIYGIPYLPAENLLPTLLEFYDSRQLLTTK